MEKFTVTEEQKEAIKQGAREVLEDVKEVARKAAESAKPVTDAAKKAVQSKPVTDVAKKAAETAKPVADAARKMAESARPVADAARSTVEQTAKRVVMKPQVYVQFNQKEVLTEELVQDAKAAYKEAGNKAAIRSLSVYVKPEDNAAYFVINEEFRGKIEL